MSKLKLEHLAPYLPYGLNMVINTPFGSQNRKLELDCGHDLGLHLMQCNVKPILRPLSDLTKEIDICGEKFVPYYWFEKYNYSCYLGFEKVCIRENHYNVFVINENSYDEKQMLNLPLRIVNKLLEWHFDVFGLIDKGLAININTLYNE